jgi:hypothetical protein
MLTGLWKHACGSPCPASVEMVVLAGDWPIGHLHVAIWFPASRSQMKEKQLAALYPCMRLASQRWMMALFFLGLLEKLFFVVFGDCFFFSWNFFVPGDCERLLFSLSLRNAQTTKLSLTRWPPAGS